ncbi:sigma-70 family RNA polymerase sigma factor [Brevibacillus humidisoli]|uniref:RNA polymerase sigma factor n=1 Tax=Brevibacillus humidisoli TaxID=2895522 RepID=UPI001E4DC2B1|nr:sigma-70 family RNA polymerase sigma factor [Brevibacillus humidisoli]UFJ39514.1 sigma-70 family RNA polymerase sigma factor [Brevibacillus humidisoli]
MSLFDQLKRNHRARSSLLDELTGFYKKYKSLVYVYFFQLTGSSEESEELTQETFYQAVKSIHRFKGHSSLKTWLLQIARNVYRNKVRSWARDQLVYAPVEVELQPDETNNPQEVALQKYSHSLIQQIFRLMPEDYRDVLIYKEVEGLSHMEIGEILNKTPQTTKVLLYRAKKRFRQLYDLEVIRDEGTV